VNLIVSGKSRALHRLNSHLLNSAVFKRDVGSKLGFNVLMNSEYQSINMVLLNKPHSSIHNLPDPQAVLHTRKVDYEAIEQEYEQIVCVYKKFNIQVVQASLGIVPQKDGGHLYNMQFARDQFFMTPKGAIMARMHSEIRRRETIFTEKALKTHGILIKKRIQGRGTFEGADALWVNKKLVIVGVGNRTNEDGFEQIREVLKEEGVECIGVEAPQSVLHLLGALQFVDKALVLVRVELVAPEIMKILKDQYINIITVPESIEVIEKHAMNFVSIAPRSIILPSRCAEMKKICIDAGITIAAEVTVSQYCNAGGGLACATGVLSRG